MGLGKITHDRSRFQEKVKTAILDKFNELLSFDDTIVKERKGNDLVLHLPHLSIPRFEFDHQNGVGCGRGNKGDGFAGNEHGEHGLEHIVNSEMLAEVRPMIAAACFTEMNCVLCSMGKLYTFTTL